MFLFAFCSIKLFLAACFFLPYKGLILSLTHNYTVSVLFVVNSAFDIFYMPLFYLFFLCLAVENGRSVLKEI